jgi:hypothetical protein
MSRQGPGIKGQYNTMGGGRGSKNQPKKCHVLVEWPFIYFVFFLPKNKGWINVGDLQGAVHFKIVKYERIKFLVIALRESIEIYAW